MICTAGHGRLLWYSKSRDKWQYLDLESVVECDSLRASKARYHFERVANLPLGILDPTDYEQFALRLEPGDLVLLYTDAVTECENAAGKQFGESGLLDVAGSRSADCPRELCDSVIRALQLWHGEQAAQDDQTIIVLQRTTSRPPPPSIGRTFHTLAKILGLESV